MNLKRIILTSLAVLTAIIIGCYYNNEEELYPTADDTQCDTLNITYETHISKIVNESCKSCHGANYATTGGGYRLDNYEDLKNSMFEVIKAIERADPGFTPMPFGAPKLSNCKIEQFKIWEKNGFPEK